MKKTTHPLYATWSGMRQRCNNPRCKAYPWYGARGVRICAAWDDFETFVADLGPRPPGTTLDRYPNPKGNYEPGNVRWATPKQQTENYSAGGHYNKVKTACKHGHPLTPENTYEPPSRPGRRLCRTCRVIGDRKVYERLGHSRTRKSRGVGAPRQNGSK